MKRLLLTMSAAALIVAGSLPACAQTAAPNRPTPPNQGAQTQSRQTQPREVPPKQFDSPDEAVSALVEAAATNDKTQLTAILGSAGETLLSSGNAAQDEQERKEFSALAAAKKHVEHSAVDASTAVLLVGEQDWPFPVPLVEKAGKWHFDAEQGAVEMQARRIGADELDAIEICQGYVDAQERYAGMQASGKAPVSYAQRIMGSAQDKAPDKEGLYEPDGNRKLVPEGFARAAWSSSPSARKPYHGYFFRVLKQQGENAPGGAHKYVAHGAMIGGFALIAWPAQYGVTGIHTFIVSHDSRVFEKDLGAGTATLAPQIVSYDPDKSWTLVE